MFRILLVFVVVMRTLTGHTSSIKSLDFHPYGDYCTSGSLDCNVKVTIKQFIIYTGTIPDAGPALCVMFYAVNVQSTLFKKIVIGCVI